MVERIKVKIGETITIGPGTDERGTVEQTEEGLKFVLEPIETPVPQPEPEPTPDPTPFPPTPTPMPPPPVPTPTPTPPPTTEPYVSPYNYPVITYTPPPRAPTPEDRPLVVDIETTGIKPWESRLVSIAMKDPMQPDSEPQIIMLDDESEMIKLFLDFYKAGGYNALIGYNLAFDYRYIWSRCLFYRLPCQEFYDAKLHDVMQILQQGKESFVFGNVPSGTLNDWATYLLGVPKLLTNEEYFEALERKDFELIAAYNKLDVEITFQLWSLIESSRRNGIQVGSQITFSENTESTDLICPVCQTPAKAMLGVTEQKCSVCETVIKHE